MVLFGGDIFSGYISDCVLDDVYHDVHYTILPTHIRVVLDLVVVWPAKIMATFSWTGFYIDGYRMVGPGFEPWTRSIFLRKAYIDYMRMKHQWRHFD